MSPWELAGTRARGLGAETSPDKQRARGLFQQHQRRQVETQRYKANNSLQSIISRAFKQKTLPGVVLPSVGLEQLRQKLPLWLAGNVGKSLAWRLGCLLRKGLLMVRAGKVKKNKPLEAESERCGVCSVWFEGRGRKITALCPERQRRWLRNRNCDGQNLGQMRCLGNVLVSQ